MSTLTFNGYDGTAEIDMDRGVCRGKILFIDDLVTYQAESPKKLQKAFEEAVADYIDTCKEVDKTPQRSLRGSFNVRVTPEIHRAATLRAVTDDVTLNEVVARAMDCYLNIRADVSHHVTVTLDENHEVQTVQALASGFTGWSVTHVTH